MLLTVAWELSWYQFGVDLSDGREPVRLRGQGQELYELPEEAQEWNCDGGRATAASSSAESEGRQEEAEAPPAVASASRPRPKRWRAGGTARIVRRSPPKSHGTRQERSAPRANCEDCMIYCVIPQALADELYDKLTEYYKDDPGVEVIIDRRKSERRSAAAAVAASARCATAAAGARHLPRLELD